ncbi:MAG: hypothetical protein R2911_20005 [Caldilineaceae bacterium]
MPGCCRRRWGWTMTKGPARRRALARLVNLGLLEEEASGSLRLHRLLQRFVVDGLGELVSEMREAVEEIVLAAARRLNQAGDPRPLLSWQNHLRHVTDNLLTNGRTRRQPVQ